MTKAELLELLKDVDDNNEIFLVSSDYDINDDNTWMAENNTEFKEVKIDKGDVYLVVEANYFN